MAVQFILRGGPAAVNIRTVTALYLIMNPLLLTVDIFSLVVVFIFSVWIFRCNYECLGYQLATMVPLMPMSHHKMHDLS